MYTSALHEPLPIWCFFFNDTATTEIYTLSLHDALPISLPSSGAVTVLRYGTSGAPAAIRYTDGTRRLDRKSTRLNSSHANISYAVFCLKNKKLKPPCLNNNHANCSYTVLSLIIVSMIRF